MNIWLPVLTNFIIVIIVFVGAVVGAKQGWRLGLIKFVLVVGDVVGSYFLIPIVKPLILRIGLINMLPAEIVTSGLFLALFLVLYLFISIGILISAKLGSKEKLKGINSAKRFKTKGLSRRETKQLKRDRKEFVKSRRQTKILKTHSKVLGCIFGVLVGIIVAMAFFLPTKYVFKRVADNNPKLEQIETGFKYTPYGQLDKVIHYTDFIVKE